MIQARRLARLVPAVLITALGCDPSLRELEQRRTTLARETSGLRQLAGRLARGEPIVAHGQVVVAVDEALVRSLLSAQLPLELAVEGYDVRLTAAEVRFHGAAVFQLHGELHLRDQPALAATLSARCALEQVAIDARNGLLRARLAVDEVTIEEASGLETLLNASALDQLALAIRSQLATLLPPLEIPVTVRQRIVLPALATGPLRIHGGTLPLRAAVSRVVAGRGTLWIGVRVEPGEVVRVEASPAPDRASTGGSPEAKAADR